MGTCTRFVLLSFMAKSLYGELVTWQRLVANVCVATGPGTRAVSDDDDDNDGGD